MKRLAIAALVAVCLIQAGARGTDRVSEPFHYEGYAKAEYPDVEKRSFYVPMSDGAKLAIDVYLPAGGPTKAFPAIVEYTPYTRAYVDIKNGPLHKSARQAFIHSKSPVLDLLSVPGGMGDALKQVIATGYVFVRADMRGCGASSGWKADFMPQIGRDGGELVDWIGKQEWCDGSVGMIGGSYSGYSQIVTAGYAGPALKAIAPVVVPLDGYNGEVYPGGVYLEGFMSAYSARLQRLNLNYYTLSLPNILFDREAILLPAAPVIDEDNDGDYADEVPVDKNRNGTFLDDYNYPDDMSDEPVYPDGGKRQHIYYLAIRDHRYNVDYHFFAQSLMYIDEKLPEPFGDLSSYNFSPSAVVPAIMKKDIAIYNIGGWFDTFARGTAEYFATLRETNPSRLLMVPGFHGGGGPYWEYLGDKRGKNFLVEIMMPELMRFFDHYLKGVDNGIDREDPILIYCLNGGGFRTEKEWPLAREVQTDFHFAGNHSLGPDVVEGKDEYVGDFSHDSRYGKVKGNRWLGAMGRIPEVAPYRTGLDKKCLTYTSDPLGADMEITGHPIVTLFVSSTADYGDFFVYLEEVDEQGQAILVSEGVHRAGFATLIDNDEIILGGGSGVDVKPDLPWHGYEKKDYTEAVFAGGKIVPVTFDLAPVSWLFKRGRRIRVSIAVSDWPTFRLHERLAPGNNPNNPANVIPTITVHRGADLDSRITLPVIPR